MRRRFAIGSITLAAHAPAAAAPRGPSIEPAASTWAVATSDHGGFRSEYPGTPQQIDAVIGEHARGYAMSLEADGVEYTAMCIYFDDASVPPLDAPDGPSRPIEVGGLEGG